MLMVFGVFVTEVLSRRGLHAFSLAPDIYLVEKKSNYKELEPTFHIGYWVLVRWAFICLLFSSSKLNLLPKKSLSDDIRVLRKRERKKRVKISGWMKNVCFFHIHMAFDVHCTRIMDLNKLVTYNLIFMIRKHGRKIFSILFCVRA